MNWLHRHVCRSARWRRRIEGLLPWALQGVELGDDVLEIGPGPGVTTELLLSRTRQLTALEVDAEAAAALQKRLNGAGVRVVHGDAVAMPFADGSFDCVLSLNTIHNFPRPRAVIAMREVQRLSNGRAFVQVDSYLTREQKEVFESWVLTAEFHDYPEGWLKVFAEAGYTGDYDWTIIE